MHRMHKDIQLNAEVILKKLTVAHRLKIFPAFYGT
jgi:hypothetical protein